MLDTPPRPGRDFLLKTLESANTPLKIRREEYKLALNVVILALVDAAQRRDKMLSRDAYLWIRHDVERFVWCCDVMGVADVKVFRSGLLRILRMERSSPGYLNRVLPGRSRTL